MSAFTSYQSYVLVLAEMAAIQNVDEPNFQAILPSAIDYAEQRIYRDLNLLATVVRSGSASANLTPNSRDFVLPQPSGQKFVAVQGVNVLVNGSRIRLIPKSLAFMDFYAPSETAIPNQNPQCYAMLTDQALVIGPAPAAAYPCEIIGTTRPKPLASDNTTTLLTQNLPDLFLAASMVFLAGFQKNFGAQADNPQAAMSWETQYQNLRKSANDEEMRKRFNTAINYGAATGQGGA